ncbi:DsbA family oxidoreductase [Pararhodobacter oceanensis]|uniref:DsbA family oxidoreductase n=1 Tax=Pararhodobacter oceanensis TaxID=2172121 RepID=UPI003A90CAB4
MTPISVDIVSDVVCPWCAIGYLQLEKASKASGIPIEVHWHPFELNPDMAPEGEDLTAHLSRKYGGTAADSVQTRERLAGFGAGLGFAFNYSDQSRMVNTFKAHQLMDWAAAQGKKHELKLALLSAYFEQQLDVSDIEVLVEKAGEVGLEKAAARAVLESGERAAAVRENQQFWTSRGIQGVPAMVFERQHLVTGAQGEENYANILQQLVEMRAA